MLGGEIFLLSGILEAKGRVLPRSCSASDRLALFSIRRSPFSIGRWPVTWTPLGPADNITENNARVTRSYGGRKFVMFVQTCHTSPLIWTCFKCVQWQDPV